MAQGDAEMHVLSDVKNSGCVVGVAQGNVRSGAVCEGCIKWCLMGDYNVAAFCVCMMWSVIADGYATLIAREHRGILYVICVYVFICVTSVAGEH